MCEDRGLLVTVWPESTKDIENQLAEEDPRL